METKRGDVSVLLFFFAFLGYGIIAFLLWKSKNTIVVFTNPTTGQQRTLDLAKKCCPNPSCPFHRKRGKGNIQYKKTYGKHYDRGLLECTGCKACFSETKGTAYANVKKPLLTFFSVLRHLAYNDGIRDIGRKVGIHRDTVMRYVRRAGTHCTKLSVLYTGLRCVEIQLDEMWSFVRKKKKNLKSMAEYLQGFGDRWTWIALDAVSKFVIAHVNGKRVEELCRKLLVLVKQRVADGKKLITSDELKVYATLILEMWGKLVAPQKTGKRGRPKQPHKVPHEEILYGIVHKTRKNGRITDVEIRAVYGALEEMQAIIEQSPVSNTINTSFVERKNLDIRQKNRRMTRKTQSFSKSPEMHDAQMEYTIAFGNFCQRHRAHGMSPAMAIGITDHIWPIEELMGFET